MINMFGKNYNTVGVCALCVCSMYSKVPNKCEVQIMLVGKSLEINKNEGPNNRVGRNFFKDVSSG